MVTSRTQPTLAFHLGLQYVAAVTEKGMFGSPYIRAGRLLMVGLWMYQTGAILGRAMKDRMEILARMFSDAGREDEACEWLRELATERIARYGKEPDSFLDFLFMTEYQRAEIEWPEDHRGVMQFDKHKAPLKQVEPQIKMFLLEGIGFGSKFPDLTERMWRQPYETLDREAWDLAREHGVNLPQEPALTTLEEREEEILIEVTAYTCKYFPQLVEPLGLLGLGSRS